MGWKKIKERHYELVTEDGEKYTIVTTQKSNWTGKKRYTNWEAHLLEEGILADRYYKYKRHEEFFVLIELKNILYKGVK